MNSFRHLWKLQKMLPTDSTQKLSSTRHTSYCLCLRQKLNLSMAFFLAWAAVNCLLSQSHHICMKLVCCSIVINVYNLYTCMHAAIKQNEHFSVRTLHIKMTVIRGQLDFVMLLFLFSSELYSIIMFISGIQSQLHMNVAVRCDGKTHP